MHEGRACVPWLDLIAEDHFDLAVVLAAWREEGAEDAVDGERDLCRERTDVVHWFSFVSSSMDKIPLGGVGHTEDFDRVRCVVLARNDQGALKGLLQSHFGRMLSRFEFRWWL